jgi:hypothetical protein
VDWGAVPPESRTLTIPRERFKSDAPHVVPLSAAALDIVAGLPHFTAGDFVFSSSDGARPVTDSARAKHKLDALMLRYLKAMARQRGEDPSAVQLPSWVLHDSRRCVRSGLAALDVPDNVGELVLGHAKRGLQRTYDLHRYQPQIREALTRWADRLKTIVAPTTPAPLKDNVVAMRKRKS